MVEAAKQIFGGFRLQEVVGHGAQGRVWRAVCTDSSVGIVPKGTSVALKIRELPDATDEKWADLEERVASLMRMHHPNVVRYLGCFRINDAGIDKHVIVQELLVGETLKTRLKNLRLGLDVDEALRIVKAAAAALEYTAGLGICHRDIKPGNIFLCSDGDVKLIDFGVAKQGEGTVTESGNVRGTFDYLAPDFIAPEFRGDESSDIFSLGVVFHEVVTSALPYADEGKGEFGYVSRWTRHVGGDASPIFIKPLARRMLQGCEKVLQKSLAPRREERYSCFREFREALDSIGFNDLKNGDRTYRWLKFIGRGGFGEVFKAEWVETGEPVAVKRLLNPTYAKRFYTEAKVMQQLKDPCFVSFVDFFVNGENAFLVMRFLDGMPGGSLRDAIDRSKKAAVQNGDAEGGGLPKPLVLSAFERYARGLSLLHHRKPSIIHRDIKPANLYYPEGRPDLVAIMDFGIVREEDSSFTSGVPPCTFDYAPPEIATTTDKGSPAMDIFALGLCLYEALTGKPAYPRIPNGMPGLRMFIERCTSMRAPKFSDPRVTSDAELLDLLNRMTDPDVSRRIADAEEVAVGLRKLFFRQSSDEECSPTMVFDGGSMEAETRPIDEKQLMEWYKAWVEKHPGESPFHRPDDSPPSFRNWKWLPAILVVAVLAAAGGAFLWPQVKRLSLQLNHDPPVPALPLHYEGKPGTEADSVPDDREAERKRREAEAERKEAERRKAQEKEVQRLKAEAEELRQRAELLAREKAEREAEERRRAEAAEKAKETRLKEESERRAREEKLRKEESARRKAQEAELKRREAEVRLKAEQLAREKAEREAEERRRAEAEKKAEEARLREEALRKAREERRRKEAAAKQKAREEERKRQDAEASKQSAVGGPAKVSVKAQGYYDEADFRYENMDYGGAFESYYNAFESGYRFNRNDRENIKESFRERMSTLNNLINRIKAALEIGRTPPRDLAETEEERSVMIERYRKMRSGLKLQ